jgi:hypothetical protein
LGKRAGGAIMVARRWRVMKELQSLRITVWWKEFPHRIAHALVDDKTMDELTEVGIDVLEKYLEGLRREGWELSKRDYHRRGEEEYFFRRAVQCKR